MQEHPEDHERIEVLKQLIALQVNPSTIIVTDTGLKAEHILEYLRALHPL